MKNQSILKNFPNKFILFSIAMLLPLFAIADDPGLPGDGDPGDPAAPISDYWWVLALIGIYFIYKKYQALHKQA
jgi:hypothetical protein